jgi:hypothetical protein
VKTEMLGVLNRERADAAGAGMDQDPLSGLRTGTSEHLHRGQPDEWQRGRFCV